MKNWLIVYMDGYVIASTVSADNIEEAVYVADESGIKSDSIISIQWVDDEVDS